MGPVALVAAIATLAAGVTGGPLATIVGVLAPSPFGAVKRTVAPNAYARALPSQTDAASDQQLRGALRGGISGLTGSEADFSYEQATGRDIGGPLPQLVDGLRQRVPRPVDWYRPNVSPELIEGRGTGYNTGAYDKGWVNLQPGDGRSWGATTRDRSPRILSGTLLYPTDRTPLPRAVAAAYAEQHRGRTRLSDTFGD